MRRVLFILALIVCISRASRADVAVLTHHNDPSRTGANLNETVLTANNVKTSAFGLVFSRAVDDQIYAQPLVMTNVNLGTNGYHNLVLVATVNDSVYAFDADNPAVSAAYWHRTFLSSGVVPPSSSDLAGSPCGSFFNISGSFGILSTPVIDPAAGTIYVLARTKETSNSVTTFVQRLHALDITTGLERSNSPVMITAAVPGTNSFDSTNGVVTFDPFKANQRCGLALVNGVVYICWASHCDWSPYHGWMIGYDATTLQQTFVYNATPNGDEGGIWMSGGAPAADTNGNIYLAIGNGTVGTSNNPSDTINRGESFVKFTPSGTNLTMDTWFTPYNWSTLEANDWDLGAAELLLIPGTNLAFSGGKGSVLYLVNRDNMGGLSTGSADTNIIQSFSINNKLFGGPVWWDGPANSYAYLWPASDYLRQYPFSRAMGQFSSTTPFAQSPATASAPGGILSLSANGSQSGTGIVWAAHSNAGSANGATVPGILEAYNAENVNTLLWSSQQNSSRDAVGNFAKFCPPTVANGKVYLATFSSKLDVYGLLSSPQLSVSPASLGFGTVAIGQTNTLSIQVVNAGGSNLTGTVTANPPFAIQSGSPFSVQSGLTGIVQVTFSPTNSGGFSNNLIFTSNGGNSTNAVTGTGAGSSPARLAVSPASVSFGIVAVGNTMQATFAITNLGGIAITNGAVAVNPPFAIVSGNPFNLAGFAGSNVVVSFTPTNTGNFSNNVAFTCNGGNSTNAVTGSGTPPAQLVVSPASVSFGTVAVGSTAQATFAITNLGGIAITNGAVAVNPPFAIVSGSPFNLAGFANSNVVVSFTPTNTGNFSNNVTFTSNGGNSTNAVTGSGTPPAQLAVSPASFDFGIVAVGNTVQATFAITNLGGIAITNGAVAVNPPFAIVSGNPFNLAGFAGSNVVISFTPTNTGNFSNNVTFTSNGGNSTNAVTGSGTPPAQLAVSPANFNFGTIAVGSTVQTSFAITNLGGIAITNGTVAVNPPFSIVSGSPFSLAGFASSNVVVSFTPTNTGNFSNNVTFACNGGNSTNAVTGSGTPPAQLAVSPTSFNFGIVAVSNTVQATFAITNLGGIAITNGTVAVNPPFSIVSGSPFSLAGFAASNVVVSFTPTNTGNFSNNVTFTCNGGNSTNAVTGSGTPPAQLAVSPASANFGTVAVGNTVQATFAITNLGGIAITNGSAIVSDPFTIVSGSPFTIAGFASSNVVVSFTPTNSGSFSNNVTFTSNGGNSTNAVTGSGTPPAQLAVSPASVNFGTIAVGNTVQASFAITNLGGTSITNGTAIVGGPFSIVSGSPFNLPGFANSNVVVSFTPTNTGNFSNNVTFMCNGGNSTNAVTGSGTPPAQLAVSPASFNFGIVAVSNTVQTTFAITNLGGITITNGTAIVGGPFSIVSGSPFTLAGFASSNVVVSFTPTNAGNFSNNVTFTSNGGNSTNAVTGSGTPPAQLAVSPASFNFGIAAVSDTVQTTFAITNLGGIAITNGTVAVNPPFAIVSGNPFNLAGFAGSNVVISFTPTNTGSFSNNVTFTSNGGNSTNAVTGSGTPPAQLGVSPANVNFGTIAVGSTIQATFAITNLGGIAITNGTVAVNPPFAIVSGSPFTLAGFAASNVVVSFSPTNTGYYSNSVVFTGNGGNSTNPVTGSGTPPAKLSVSPTGFNFGIVAVSNTVQTTFAITNLGGIAITNGTAIVGGPFSIVSGSPFTLPGFASSNVVVSFTPTNSGSFSNNITFTSNGGNSTNAVTGSGTPPALLSVSPASFNFGIVAVSNMVQTTFAITNLGGIAITNGTAVVGPPFAIVSGSPFTLPGFTSSNVVVSCTPTDTDTYSNNVIFTSNGGNSANAVTGAGALPPTASFSGTPATGAWPLLVLFTNNSSGTITNAFWSFGDGANTNTLNSSVTHDYGTAGTNTVMLTVSGPVGTNTETLSGYIVVTDPPPVTLNISLSGNQVQLAWPQGTLQSANQATGTYADLTNGSPYFVTPSNAAQYYRVRVR